MTAVILQCLVAAATLRAHGERHAAVLLCRCIVPIRGDAVVPIRGDAVGSARAVTIAIAFVRRTCGAMQS